MAGELEPVSIIPIETEDGWFDLTWVNCRAMTYPNSLANHVEVVIRGRLGAIALSEELYLEMCDKGFRRQYNPFIEPDTEYWMLDRLLRQADEFTDGTLDE